VDTALKHNFDTSAAISAISEIVNKANVYIMENQDRKALLLNKIGEFVSQIFGIFGVDFTSGAGNTAHSEADIRPHVRTLADFRKKVRNAAKEKQPAQSFMQLCDELRDEIAPHLGIKFVDDSKIDDFYIMDKDIILAEQAKKRAEVNAQQRATKENQLNTKKKRSCKMGKIQDFSLCTHFTKLQNTNGDRKQPYS